MTVISCFEHKVEQLQTQLQHVESIPFYAEFYRKHDVDVGDISSLKEFQTLPFTSTKTLLEAYDEYPPDGSFFSDDVRQINMTPAGDGLMPEYNTEQDLERVAEAMGKQYAAMGVGAGDRALNTTGYTVFIGGLAGHSGLQEAGAAVVPVGPGDSEQAAGLMDRLAVNVIQAFPSYGLKVAEHTDTEVDIYIGGGEPFTSVPGLREEVRDAYGGDATVVDVYALSEILPVAAECKHEDGLHVSEDFVLVEVIDPETEQPVELGERGEIVLTHLDKEAMPLVRYRTGDLTRVVKKECDCGRSITLPDGVFGRVDNRLKLKGVKFYPDSIGPVLVDFPGLTGNFQVEASRPSETDHLKIICETEPGAGADTGELEDALSRELVVRPDEVELAEGIDEDETVRDLRY